MPANTYLPTTVTSTPKQIASTPVSNAGTLKYIESMKQAGQQANAAKAANDAINEKYKAHNDALIAHYGGTPANNNGGNDGGDGGSGGAGGAGGSGGSGSGSGVKKVTVSSGGGGRGGISSSLNETPVQTVPDTTVQDAYKAQMDAANERL